MGFFSNLFNKIFKRKTNQQLLEGFMQEMGVELPKVEETPKEEEYIPIDFPENELVSFDDEVLDTESRASEEKLKHNLEVLIKKAKEEGKVDNFKLIREDDFFPDGWEWRVLSKDTNLEMVSTTLSYELRKAYALEQSGKPAFVELMGMKMPNYISGDEIYEALSKVDKTVGNVLLPSRFRSTKHFTVNTPLGVTGDYNSVQSDRDYIIIDDMKGFLDSDYAYSTSYHDAYLDVSHESLPISENAVVLINDEKYERIIQDEKVANQLAQRKVIRFKGDEVIAIDMVLSQMGVLPSRVGSRYAHYDNEIHDILDSSMRNLAKDNDLFFDRSHAGELKADGGGHFSNYYDDKNRDYEKAVQEFIGFLKQKFPEQADVFPENMRFTEGNAQDIIQRCGTTALIDAIGEYNELAKARADENLEKYKQDRASITPEIHEKFVSTIGLINDYYKGEVTYSSYDERLQTEESIRKFLQSGTVEEQLEAAESVIEMLPSRSIEKQENVVEAGTISMKALVANAISNEKINEAQVQSADDIEHNEKAVNLREGETLSDR